MCRIYIVGNASCQPQSDGYVGYKPTSFFNKWLDNPLTLRQICAPKRNFRSTFSRLQSTTTHRVLLWHCATTFPHHSPFNSITFTHPPTQADIAASISIWIATAFDDLAWCSSCSACWNAQPLEDLRGKIHPRMLLRPEISNISLWCSLCLGSCFITTGCHLPSGCQPVFFSIASL